MLCVSCGQRKGKRACPALRGPICPTCCGTKRLKDIACPADCSYLASAQAHPAAAVLRQRERDMPLLSSLVDGLNATQGDLLALLASQVRSARVGAIPPLRDEDIREAAGALASTLETAARGIVYEHQPASIPALRVMRGWQQALAEIERRGQTLRPGVVAPVLRRIEQTARDAAKVLGALQPGPHSGPQATALKTRAPTPSRQTALGAPAADAGGGDDHSDVAFLDFLDRVIGGQAGERDAPAPEGGAPGGGLLHGTQASSGLILP